MVLQTGEWRQVQEFTNSMRSKEMNEKRQHRRFGEAEVNGEIEKNNIEEKHSFGMCEERFGYFAPWWIPKSV